MHSMPEHLRSFLLDINLLVSSDSFENCQNNKTTSISSILFQAQTGIHLDRLHDHMQCNQ